MLDIIWRSVIIGIGATALMDIWTVLYGVTSGGGLPNWAPAGRWFKEVAKGRVFHDDINAAEPYRHERTLGWIGHYAVGIIYGLLLVLIVGSAWLDTPTFLPAWIFAIVAVGAGWFLMQPGMGLGVAASKTPNPNKVRVLNLVAHTFFALGLYGTALLIR